MDNFQILLQLRNNFKLIFEELTRTYCLLIVYAFLVDEDNINKFYDSASKIELCMGNVWIHNVATLHE